MTVDRRLEQTLAELSLLRQAARQFTLPEPDGTGTSGGMTPWEASVEDRLTALRDDVREVRNWLAAGMGFVLIALAGGFFFLLTKMDAASDRADLQLSAVREGQVRIETILNERLPAKSANDPAPR